MTQTQSEEQSSTPTTGSAKEPTASLVLLKKELLNGTIAEAILESEFPDGSGRNCAGFLLDEILKRMKIGGHGGKVTANERALIRATSRPLTEAGDPTSILPGGRDKDGEGSGRSTRPERSKRGVVHDRRSASADEGTGEAVGPGGIRRGRKQSAERPF